MATGQSQNLQMNHSYTGYTSYFGLQARYYGFDAYSYTVYTVYTQYTRTYDPYFLYSVRAFALADYSSQTSISGGIVMDFIQDFQDFQKFIELDYGRILTGNPYIFDGKNHGFPVKISPTNQSNEKCRVA